jgi:hypothetical protein
MQIAKYAFEKYVHVSPFLSRNLLRILPNVAADWLAFLFHIRRRASLAEDIRDFPQSL